MYLNETFPQGIKLLAYTLIDVLCSLTPEVRQYFEASRRQFRMISIYRGTSSAI